MNRINEITGKLITGIMTLYFASVFLVFAPYYNWKYAAESGFTEWLMLGEIVPTAKAFIWPYYVYTGVPSIEPKWTEEERDNGEHFFKSLEFSNAATQLSNQGDPSRIEKIPEERGEQIHALQKTALTEATLVRDEILEKASPGLSIPFRQIYQRSIELKIRAYERGDTNAAFEGVKLNNEWGDWLNAHRREIRFRKKRS